MFQIKNVKVKFKNENSKLKIIKCNNFKFLIAVFPFSFSVFNF